MDNNNAFENAAEVLLYTLKSLQHANNQYAHKISALQSQLDEKKMIQKKLQADLDEREANQQHYLDAIAMLKDQKGSEPAIAMIESILMNESMTELGADGNDSFSHLEQITGVVKGLEETIAAYKEQVERNTASIKLITSKI
jgi:hypothetical protein